MVFTSPETAARAQAQSAIEAIVAGEGLTVLGWRDIPTDNASLGAMARDAEPFMRQLFIGRPEGCTDQPAFEGRLYLVPKRSGLGPFWYVASISSRTMIYKGMLTTSQLESYYPDRICHGATEHTEDKSKAKKHL